jgi:serine/threonine-protein kinase
VLDFGLAKPVAGGPVTDGGVTATMTGAGLVVGTCQYMSPEQARGQSVDARSDIFALGVVCYEMLTGRRPFTGDTPTEILSSIIKDTPPAVSSIRTGIPRELERIVRHCLAKDPARRKQSALDVRNELEDLKREIDSGDLGAPVQPLRRNRRAPARPGGPPRQRSAFSRWPDWPLGSGWTAVRSARFDLPIRAR